MVTAAIAASVEGSMPHGALFVLICVCLMPALLVDVLVLRSPQRHRGPKDPLTRPRDHRRDRRN